jgi:Amt family ammonium transporter
VPIRVSPGWLTLAILLLWVGWFGFNPGSVLQFNDEAVVVVLTTFLAASAAALSTVALAILLGQGQQKLLLGVNGVLMGLIVITPLAGFVSPGSAIVLGLLAGPVFLGAEWYFSQRTWFSDPVGLFPGHMVGGVFGIAMIPLFAQTYFATGSGFPGLPNGLLFGGGWAAVHQLGLEVFGVVVVLITVFVLSFATIWLLGRVAGGVLAPASGPTTE